MCNDKWTAEAAPNCKHEAIPNYEEEYRKLRKENSLLQKENAELKETIIKMCKWLFTKGGNNL